MQDIKVTIYLFPNHASYKFAVMHKVFIFSEQYIDHLWCSHDKRDAITKFT